MSPIAHGHEQPRVTARGFGDDRRRDPDFDAGDPYDVAVGASFEIAWAPVAGANDVVVDQAAITIEGVTTEEPLASMTPTASASRFLLTFPTGTRLRRLTLTGLVFESLGPDGATVKNTIASRADLETHNLRLVVLMAEPGQPLVTRYTVPEVAATKFTAALFAGASFAGGAITLPDVRASKVGIALVAGGQDDPGSFEPADSALTSVEPIALNQPMNVKLDGPEGPVWSSGEELPESQGRQTIDLHVAIAGALRAKVAAGAAPTIALTLSGTRGRVLVTRPLVLGGLVRRFPGVTRVEVRGEAIELPLAAPALAAEMPSQVTADVTVQYRGLRLLGEATDAAPAPSAPIAGSIVGAVPVVRPLGAIAGLSLGMVGLIGRVPESCELSVWPVDPARARGRAIDAVERAALSEPGVVRVAPTTAVAPLWIELPERVLTGDVALAVRANLGRFYWAAGAAPLVRVAVRDPDPGGRPLRLAGIGLLDVHHDPAGTVEHHVGLALPAAGFAGAAPTLDSELFVTVDVSDLTLRYER